VEITNKNPKRGLQRARGQKVLKNKGCAPNGVKEAEEGPIDSWDETFLTSWERERPEKKTEAMGEIPMPEKGID